MPPFTGEFGNCCLVQPDRVNFGKGDQRRIIGAMVERAEGDTVRDLVIATGMRYRKNMRGVHETKLYVAEDAAASDRARQRAIPTCRA